MTLQAGQPVYECGRGRRRGEWCKPCFRQNLSISVRNAQGEEAKSEKPFLRFIQQHVTFLRCSRSCLVLGNPGLFSVLCTVMMVVNGSWLFVAPHLSHNARKDEGRNVTLTQKTNEVVNQKQHVAVSCLDSGSCWTADERSVPVRIIGQ